MSMPSWSVSTISIHPPRAGRDVQVTHALPANCKFQSTRPVRGGTHRIRRGTGPYAISIHPPRAGRDVSSVYSPPTSYYFNPPAPCGAGRCRSRPALAAFEFQSTRPVRGGTRLKIDYEKTGYISIHPPRAGRDFWVALEIRLELLISIHPPRAGRDQLAAIERWPETQFQSTRPVRGGTSIDRDAGQSKQISIHPPRAGRDY